MVYKSKKSKQTTSAHPQVVKNQNYQTRIKNDPGYDLGIASLISSFLFGPAGIIFGLLSFKESKKVGLKNGMAVAGVVIGSISTVLMIIFTILIVATYSGIVQKCNELGDGVHHLDGVTYICNSHEGEYDIR